MMVDSFFFLAGADGADSGAFVECFLLVTAVGDFDMKAGIPISIMSHGSHIAIPFKQGVFTLNYVAIAFLMLVLKIACLLILYTIFERITWVMVLI